MSTEKLKQYRLNKMVEEVEDYAILLIDKQGNVENWNKGAMKLKGYEAHEIIGKNFSNFYTEEDRKNKKPERLLAIAEEKGSVSDEGWRIRKDGSKFWGSVVITAIHDDDGSIVGFTKVTRDLTAKKLIEEEREIHLQHMESRTKEMEWLAYITSHDLQEPLRTIRSFMELFARKYNDNIDDDGKMMIDVMTQAAARMQDLIKGILEYSIIGSNKEVTDVDCNKLIEGIIDDFSTLISQTGTTIDVQSLPIIKGYPSELRQLFQNLISNAIKFRKPDVPPHITIRAEQQADKWLFSVADNGIGIEQKYFEKIFMMFQRLHGRKEYAGTGIGLTYVKKIIELHNGQIWPESEPGKGTTFYISLNK